MDEKRRLPAGDAELVPSAGKLPKPVRRQPKDEEARGLPSPIPQLESGDINLQTIAEALKLDFVADLRPKMIDQSVRKFIPEEIARRYKVIALRREAGAELVVATSDPANIFITDELPERLNVAKIVQIVAPEQDILACIDATYLSPDSDMTELKLANQFPPPLEPRPNELVLQESNPAEAPSASSIVHALLIRSLKIGASDISIEPGENETMIRLKVDGRLRELDALHSGWHRNIVAFIKAAASLDTTENRRPLDGHLTVSHLGKHYDIRVATMPVIWGEGVTLRILNPQDAERSLEQIGFDESAVQVLDKQIHLPNGVILVTGPTGSGKTTTLYACLGRLNTEDTKIITIEDPVEYQVGGFNQSSVNDRIGLGFTEALKASLRQIPDVILIGEMRDTETANVAMRAALTGHLVFSTLHTNDAVSTIIRLIEMGIPKFIIAESVRAIVAQRLVRKLCNRCARKSGDRTLAGVLGIPDDVNIERLKSAVGCQLCHGGYQGRTAIHETLVVSDEIRSVILRGSEPGSMLRRLVREAGMITMQQDGCRKALQGITTLEEVSRLTALNG